MSDDPKKDEIAKRHAIALCRYLSNCNGEPQLIQLTEAFRSALTDYEALRETSESTWEAFKAGFNAGANGVDKFGEQHNEVGEEFAAYCDTKQKAGQ